MYGDHNPTPGVQQVSGGVNSTHLALRAVTAHVGKQAMSV